MSKLYIFTISLLLAMCGSARAEMSTKDHDFISNIGMMDSYIDHCGSHLHIDQAKLAALHEKLKLKYKGADEAAVKETHDTAYEINGDILSDEGLELGCITAPSISVGIFGDNSPVSEK